MRFLRRIAEPISFLPPFFPPMWKQKRWNFRASASIEKGTLPPLLHPAFASTSLDATDWKPFRASLVYYFLLFVFLKTCENAQTSCIRINVLLETVVGVMLFTGHLPNFKEWRKFTKIHRWGFMSLGHCEYVLW